MKNNVAKEHWRKKDPELHSIKALRVTAATHKATIGLAHDRGQTVDELLRKLLWTQRVSVK